MGRRTKPAKRKANAKRQQPDVRRSPKDDSARIRDLEKRLADTLEQLHTRDRERVEAQERQTATMSRTG